MTKRSRASLKDTPPETLGFTPKKGKGIDLLFGGPLETESGAASGAADAPAAGPVEAAAAPAGAANYGDRAVDELGLPVALEAPPDDLVLASPPADTAADDAGAAGAEVVNPTTSPFAMPQHFDVSSVADATDLTGILDDDNSPKVEEENLANSAKDLSGTVEDTTLAAPVDTGVGGVDNATDLSGLVVEDTSAVAAAAPVPASTPTTANDLSGLTAADEGLSGSGVDTGAATVLPAAAPPPTTAAPINVAPAPVYAPPITTQPATLPAVDATPYTAPAVNIPPPSTATGAPSLSPPRIAAIGSVSGIVTDRTAVSAQDILPEDVMVKSGDAIIAVEKRDKLAKDPVQVEKIVKYIGPERRQKLDDEIEQLFQTVSNELSDNKDDAAFALKTLQEAQEIVIEDISDYDDAVYRVAVVRTMLVRKQHLRKWSYTWGMLVFGYAIFWLAAFVYGLLYVDLPVTVGMAPGAAALRSAWITSLWGGIGGVMAILYSLSWRVAFKQEFDRQYIMKYLVQPIMGFMLGAVIFFITSAGFLLFNPSANTSTGEMVVGGSQMVAIQIILGFIAGFRQRVVYLLIDKIVQKIAPEEGDTKGPSSVVPVDDYAKITASRSSGE